VGEVTTDGDRRWAVGELQEDDQITVVTWRQDVSSDVRGRLPEQFIVVWTFSHPEPTGLPKSDELREAAALQELLVPALEADGASMLAFACTGGGVREMYFHCADPLQLQGRLNDVVAGRVLPVTLHAGHDPEWSVYVGYVAAFTRSESPGAA
jgi:hypothetical protein